MRSRYHAIKIALMPPNTPGCSKAAAAKGVRFYKIVLLLTGKGQFEVLTAAGSGVFFF